MRLWPVAVDVLCVLVFAIVGRSSHGEANDLLGVARTAWPFLVGCLAGAAAGRVWRRPATVASGVPVWLGALLVGMLLRVLTGAGIQPTFVLVAGLVLAAFFLGWRAVLGLVRRVRPSRALG
jgi:hypothetical protein